MKNNLFSAIVLAAGNGTRMKSSLPKVLHRIGGQTMIGHLIDTLHHVGCESICLVTSPSMEEVRQSTPSLHHAVQTQPLGTAHAVLAAESFIHAHPQDILILYGDVPLITSDTLGKMVAKGKNHEIVVLGMHVREDNAYGRIMIDAAGQVEEVVEALDCTAQQGETSLCNSGILFIRHQVALPLLKKIGNQNKKEEFYLTDLIKIARQERYSVGVEEGRLEELQGINTQLELALAEKIFQQRKRKEFLETGVSMIDPETVYVSYDTEMSPDVTLEPHVVMGPGVKLGRGVKVKSFSHLEGVKAHQDVVIGPFARLRPGTVLGEKSKIGNFVEIKKSHIGDHTKVSHLSYIGDASLGDHVNIGAGTITCNYDGYEKHQTIIREGVFVGSNTALVAPVTVGKDAMIGAGSVITQDVPEDDVAISRAPQKNIRDASKRFRSRHSKK